MVKRAKLAGMLLKLKKSNLFLSMVGAEFRSQSVTTGGKNSCDKMDVKTDKGKKTSYFEINKVLVKESKLFNK
jgi:hypothetical protein